MIIFITGKVVSKYLNIKPVHVLELTRYSIVKYNLNMCGRVTGRLIVVLAGEKKQQRRSPNNEQFAYS